MPMENYKTGNLESLISGSLLKLKLSSQVASPLTSALHAKAGWEVIGTWESNKADEFSSSSLIQGRLTSSQ